MLARQYHARPGHSNGRRRFAKKRDLLLFSLETKSDHLYQRTQLSKPLAESTWRWSKNNHGASIILAAPFSSQP
jgi:hypothetical protein